MRKLSTILLAGALTVATSVAFAQVSLGGRGSASGSVNGGAGGLSTNGSGRAGAGVNAGASRGGAHIGVGGHSRGSSRPSSGIGNSRVNSAISGQSRGRGGARMR